MTTKRPKDLPAVSTPTAGDKMILDGATTRSITVENFGIWRAAVVETLTNKTLTTPALTAPAIAGGTANGLTALSIANNGFNHAIASGGTYTGNHTTTIITNDGSRILTLGSDLTISGAFSMVGGFNLTLTPLANSNVNVPASGTLATLAGAETFTNKTLTAPAINTPTISGGSANALTGLSTVNSGFQQSIVAGGTLTGNHTLTVNLNNIDSTVTLNGNANFSAAFALSGGFATTFTTTGITSVTFPTAGTLAATSNNLGAFAATTSAQLAGVMSDETGSGALVFGTSPTLVTPALGTPSALVLTNATGLPLSGHTTQAAFTLVGNNTSGAAAPTAVDIAALTSKASPAASDLVMISDQAASGAWKKATVSSVSAAGSVSSIAGNTGAFTLSRGISNSTNDIRLAVPYFFAYKATDQTVSNATPVTLTLDTEVFDTNNWFASNTFTPQLAGTYEITCAVYGVGSSGATRTRASIFKNGSVYAEADNNPGTATAQATIITAFVAMNGSTDTITGSGMVIGTGTLTFTGGTAPMRTFLQGKFVSP